MTPQIPDATLKKPFADQRVLWPLSTGFTFLALGFMIMEFATKGTYTAPPIFMTTYITILMVYAGDKEVSRWTGRQLPSKWGSVFVYCWFILFAIAALAKTFDPSFVIPTDLSNVCMQVLGIFFTSKTSSRVYARKTDKAKAAADSSQSLDGAETPSLLATHEEAIMALFDERDKLHNREVATALGISVASSRRIMQNLETQGKVVQQGEGRGIYYVLAEKS